MNTDKNCLKIANGGKNMHNCQNCGKAFEGNFCPECGTPVPPEVCPGCGAALSPENKFCPECGRKSDAPQQPRIHSGSEITEKPKKEKNAQGASPALVKACSLLPYAAATFFALFSFMMYLMCWGQVSTVMGMGTGSIYDYLSMGGSEQGELIQAIIGRTADVCTALVVFTVLGAVLAVCALAFRLYTPLRVKKLGRMRICTWLEGVILAFYFTDFLLGCILCGSVSDEITSPGAGTVCILVFALFFGLCSAGAVILQKFLPKFSPAVSAELQRKKAERRAAMEPPVKPEKQELRKPQKPQYRGAECSDELKEKIVKHVKAKNLLMVFSGIVFVLCVSIYLDVWCVFNQDESIFVKNTGIFMEIFIRIAPPLMIILGGIFGALYRKKRVPGFAWQNTRAWSNKAMLWTVSGFCIALFLCGAIIIGDLITNDPNHFSHSFRVILFVYFIPIALIYCITVFSVAGAIVRSGKKLSLAVYGAKYPWLNRELQEQYLADSEAYLLQEKEYLAKRQEQQAAWHEYRKRLAYYEEGIAYPK